MRKASVNKYILKLIRSSQRTAKNKSCLTWSYDRNIALFYSKMNIYRKVIWQYNIVYLYIYSSYIIHLFIIYFFSQFYYYYFKEFHTTKIFFYQCFNLCSAQVLLCSTLNENKNAMFCCILMVIFSFHDILKDWLNCFMNLIFMNPFY